jgi:hypothetical protein
MDIERNKLMALKVNGNYVVVTVVDDTLSHFICNPLPSEESLDHAADKLTGH